MKQTYKIEGMTCGSCKASVEKSILSLKEVKNISVDLNREEATISLTQNISIEKLQNVLPKKYTISKVKTNLKEKPAPIKNKDKTDLKQLYPLFLIFAYLFTASVLIHINSLNISDFMITFMGLFFIVFSFFKFLDIQGFAMSFKMYDPLAKKISAYALIYPFLELTLGLFFLMNFKILLALIATIIILGITTIGVTKSLLDKKSIKCACLGAVLNLPMTKATFIENSIMIFMALFMIFKMV